MKKKIFSIILAFVSIIVVFVTSFFSGFFVYNNSNSLISSILDSYSSTSSALVEAQKITSNGEWSLEEWQNIKNDVDIPLSNVVSRVVRSVIVKDFDGNDCVVSTITASVFEDDTRYSDNHIYLNYGQGWQNIADNYVYISTNFALQHLINTSQYGSLDFKDLIGKPLVLSAGDNILNFKIGGIFSMHANSYSYYYSECIGEEIFYLSLENSFALSSISEEGFVTYESSSNSNFETYRFIENNKNISTKTFYNNLLNLDISNVVAFYSNKMRFLYFALLLLADLFFIYIFGSFVYLTIRDKIFSESKNKILGKFVSVDRNYCYSLSTIIILIFCLFVFLFKDSTLNFKTALISFMNPGSMCIVSISFLVLITSIWISYFLHKKEDNFFIFDEDSNSKIVTLSIKI